LRVLPVLFLVFLACTVYALPVAVKNVADVPLEGYVVFFTVESSRLGEEGIDPASMCATDPTGSYLPLWVVPETIGRSSVAVYVKIPNLAPGEQTVITLTPGPCKHNPNDIFTFFDNFTTFNTKYWAPFASLQVYNVTIQAQNGLLIQGAYMAPSQYVQVVSPPFTPPLAVEALVTPMTAYDHDACLDLREYGTESAHPSQARGAYIHAWGWGVSGTTESKFGRFAWYRLAGPPGSATYYWDVTTWDEGGTSPVWNANDTFLFRVGVSAEGARYEVWQLTGDGLKKLLGHNVKPGITNETVIALGQECGGAYNFTQKAFFHWVLVRPFAWPEPKVAVGAERVEENPYAAIIEFLTRPSTLILLSWGVIVVLLVLILFKARRSRS
jgi:hypothetical protein